MTLTNGHRSLRAGDIITPLSASWRCHILAARRERVSTHDCFPEWRVLYVREHPYHPFVVHTAVDTPEGWSFVWGHYFATHDEAVAHYEGAVG
jgi:hypothetical protein